MTPAQLVARLADGVDAFHRLLRSTPPDRPVATCPGWDVSDLGQHLTSIHGWATAALRTPPDGPEPDEPPLLDATGSDLATEYVFAAQLLLDTLDDLDADTPCWSFAPPSRAAFWARRQAHEVAVHRYDLQRAAGEVPTRMPVELAVDEIDEVVTMFFPRQVRLGRIPPLTRSLAIRPTDAEARWILAGDGLAPDSGVDTAEATVEGTAHDLALLLWHRGTLDDRTVTLTGDESAARAVLATRIVP